MMMKKRLPKHLKEVLDQNMKTDKGRRVICDMVGGAYYSNKAGKKVKRRQCR